MQIQSTKAAILVENHKPLVVDEIRMPDHLHFGQVLVELSYSGICGAQLNEIDAAKGPDKFLPHLLGHEGSGRVLEIGEGVKTVKPGDHVVLHWRPSAGLQAEPPKYGWGDKIVNAGWVTTFNQHAVISENRLTTIPKNFDMKLAPLFGCAVTTALGVVNNDAQIKVGQSVVVFGAGGVGLSVCQMASLVSANPIIAIDVNDAKTSRVLLWGATHSINSKSMPDIESEVKKILGGEKPDVIIDTTGNNKVIELAYGLTHPDGKTILVGVPRKDQNVSIYTLPLHFNQVLKGSHGGSVFPDKEIPRLIRLVNSERLKLEGLITHEYDFQDINTAISTVRTGEAGRVLLKM